ncbi:MAG: hypothetical protein IJF19_03645 [Clostridia bacterium]|nr:hypothetical protein [Clostridia bacterium]
MKKILAMLLAVISVLSLSACMGGGTKVPTATDPSDPASVVYTDYNNNLEGLCDYLEDLGYMVFDYDASKDEAGTATMKMSAELIGAEKGYKSTFKHGNDLWTIEVYYYKDTASDMYKQAQSGTVVLTEEIENGSFEITVNGNYGIVIHTPKNGEEREKAIIEAFGKFYA